MSIENDRMSALAGFLLILYGAAAAYVGYDELYVTHLQHLTKVAAFSTLGIGGVLAAVGLAHFVAPHKAFLMSIPMLLYFHVQCFIDASFFFAEPRYPFQLGLIVFSFLIVILSYRGYKAKQATATAAAR
jgi:hypothetical protein